MQTDNELHQCSCDSRMKDTQQNASVIVFVHMLLAVLNQKRTFSVTNERMWLHAKVSLQPTCLCPLLCDWQTMRRQ